MKIIVDSSGLETDFSELKDPVAFLDSIKKREISMEEAQHKKEEFNRYLTKIRIGDNSEKQKKHWLILISFLIEETMLLNFVDDYGSMILELKEKQLK